MAQLNPYLHFDGTCREAMEFYKECLGGDLEMMTIEDTPWAKDMPEMSQVPKDNILHSALKKDNWVLMASDMMDPSSFIKGDTVSVSLTCDSKEEIETLYKKLSEGGDIFMELAEQPFGTFAMFTDKFGTEWMMQYSKNNK